MHVGGGLNFQVGKANINGQWAEIVFWLDTPLTFQLNKLPTHAIDVIFQLNDDNTILFFQKKKVSY